MRNTAIELKNSATGENAIFPTIQTAYRWLKEKGFDVLLPNEWFVGMEVWKGCEECYTIHYFW